MSHPVSGFPFTVPYSIKCPLYFRRLRYFSASRFGIVPFRSVGAVSFGGRLCVRHRTIKVSVVTSARPSKDVSGLDRIVKERGGLSRRHDPLFGAGLRIFPTFSDFFGEVAGFSRSGARRAVPSSRTPLRRRFPDIRDNPKKSSNRPSRGQEWHKSKGDAKTAVDPLPEWQDPTPTPGPHPAHTHTRPTPFLSMGRDRQSRSKHRPRYRHPR